MWLRALIVCDDVRLEAGGTVSLVGVYADTIFVPAGEGDIVLPRLSTYTIVAGLREVEDIAWRQSLMLEDAAPGPQIAGGRDPHDPSADEHRIVNIMTPLVLPGAGRYRLATEIETRRERRSIDHYFAVARLAANN